MNLTDVARRLRREQTQEEKELWQALRAGRFAGFKFRRQHVIEGCILDFYCAAARLSIELDGSQHGFPDGMARDEERTRVLERNSIKELRFWNRQWQTNREGLLFQIWRALHEQTGCVKVVRRRENHRYVPPDPRLVGPSP